MRKLALLFILSLSLAACGSEPVIPQGCGMDGNENIVCPNGQNGQQFNGDDDEYEGEDD